LKYARPEIIDYVDGKISVFALIKLGAEMKKSGRSPTLRHNLHN